MATPKRKKPAKSSQDRANHSREKAQRKAIPSETIMKSHRLSDGTGVQPTRRSTMAAEDIKKRAEEMKKRGNDGRRHGANW